MLEVAEEEAIAGPAARAYGDVLVRSHVLQQELHSAAGSSEQVLGVKSTNEVTIVKPSAE